MARILVKEKGAATVVLLSKSDRAVISGAFNEYCASNKLTAAAVASQIGVSRQSIYALLKASEIELQRFIKIQNVLNVWLLDEMSVRRFTDMLFLDLLPP